MKKSEFIREVTTKAGLDQSDTEAVINATVETIIEILKDEDSINITGLGTFSTSFRKARKGRNPRTGEELEIAARNVVKFKPAPKLKYSI